MKTLRFFLFFTLLLSSICNAQKQFIKLRVTCDSYVKSKSNSNNLENSFNKLFQKVISSDLILQDKLHSLNNRKVRITIHISYTEKIKNIANPKKIFLLLFKLENDYSSSAFYKSLSDLENELEREDLLLHKQIANFLTVGLTQK